MDYTALGLAGTALLACLASATVAAHRGGTLRLNLPFVTFDGNGLALTWPIRTMFAVIAFASLACATLTVFGSFTTDSSGPTGGQKPGADSAPEVTATVTVPDDGEPTGDPDGGEPTEGTGSDKGGDGRLVEAWSGCEFRLHYKSGFSVDSVDDDICPEVAEETSGVYAGSVVSDEVLVGAPGVSASAWENNTPPTAEQCRTRISRGGTEGVRISVGESPNSKGFCLRLPSGDRYVSLRFTDATIHGWNSYTISGTATAWDVVR